jgi:spermidine synthase
MAGLLYLLFFCSGLSGLIYQVVWVRAFGNVFGNTIHSTSLVVAVFMLGLGVGGYAVGGWADRRYRSQPEALLRTYGIVELIVGLLGLGISVLLPRLGQVSALVTSYSRGANGWFVLSTTSHLARAGIAVVLLTPITFLMGGTLTLLIRHLVRSDVAAGSARIAILYAVNTAGAALGCLLTDFLLVPAAGLFQTQLVAVSFNVVAGVGALLLARNVRLEPDVARRQPSAFHPQPSGVNPLAVPLAGLTLAMCGCAAMGMEILWFRHFSILLGGFRAVFSLLLTVILVGIGAGSQIAGFVLRRRTSRPAQWLMIVQAVFVLCTLIGLAGADGNAVGRAVTADRALRSVESAGGRAFAELWFNARPMLAEVLLPALMMGFSFPLGNAIIQRSEYSVGRRAGMLYLANTCGAVCGSLAAGFLLLPTFGIQGSATILTAAAGLAVIPLYLATRQARVGHTTRTQAPAALIFSLLTAAGAVALWLLLPSNYLVVRAAPASENERLVALSEGLTEVVAVIDETGRGRTLFTNGHPMSSTSWLAQRYMRALAHIPLLSIEKPETVLVIGFGVGNTTHAASLHPSIRRVEVADLSRGILAHAGYFADVNRNVLSDPRVTVYVNDGRNHLQMQPAGSYDLITLEPPPIGYAGVSALYSSEFYALARTRLKPSGYLSQWLPAYQVPSSTTLSMIRAFKDVFPQAVLLSGSEADLLLVGTNGSRIEVGPERLVAALENAPAVQADLRRVDLGSVREIVGTFVGSAGQLEQATRASAAVTDDRPIQEYGVKSLLNFGEAVPGAVVNLGQVAAWCPTCFAGGKPVPLADGLDSYLALLERAYLASPIEGARARNLAERQGRTIAGSAYLGAIVPESAELHNVVGIGLAQKGRIDDAIAEFREALRLEPDSAMTRWHLGAALASGGGSLEEAIEHLRRSVALDPNNAQARNDLGVVLELQTKQSGRHRRP